MSKEELSEEKLLRKFIYDKRELLKITGVMLGFLFLFFLIYHLPLVVLIYAGVLLVVALICKLAVDYRRYKAKYEQFQKLREIVCLPDIQLWEAESMEEQEYQDLLHKLQDRLADTAALKDHEYDELVTYDSLWVHQIKVPIAAMRLVLQTEYRGNNRELLEELFRIEEYVDMMLYYHRLEHLNSDLVFANYDIEEIVKDVIHKYAKIFIRKHIAVDVGQFHLSVLTDEKWLRFVLEQIVSNALKYTKSGTISIYMEEDERALVIRDTGIGIEKEDLERVFERGFTGNNGRNERASTGLGLYLCKHIVDELSHSISIESEVKKGTAVTIAFK